MTSHKAFATDAGSYMIKFESMTEVVDYTDPGLFKKQSAKFCGDDKAGESFDAAEAKTKEAWDFGMATLEAFVERLRAASLPELKSKVSYSAWSFDEGDDIDLERMAQGLPYMRKIIRDNKGGPSEMTVIIDTTTPWFVDSTDILWRGACAVALTQLMEERGYRCEVWVVNGSYLYGDDHRPVMTSCCLKRTSDPLDVSTLVNTVSGWFYRSVTFTLLETICRKEGHSVAPGYGHCATPAPKDLDSISRDALRVYASGVFSFSGAVDMLVAEVARAAAMSQGKDGGEQDAA